MWIGTALSTLLSQSEWWWDSKVYQYGKRWYSSWMLALLLAAQKLSGGYMCVVMVLLTCGGNFALWLCVVVLVLCLLYVYLDFKRKQRSWMSVIFTASLLKVCTCLLCFFFFSRTSGQQ